MSEPLARIARILQPIRDDDGNGSELTTDRGALAHNPAIVDVETIPGVMNAQECAKVLAMASHLSRKSGDPVNTGRIPRQEETAWIYERMADVFERANKKYRFRVVGLIEEPQVTLYAQGDPYPWQMDCARNFTANRKLSISVALMDPLEYHGGVLEFPGREPAKSAPPAGTAIIFPSFLAHRMSPVTQGRRVSLVAYAYGPTFE